MNRLTNRRRSDGTHLDGRHGICGLCDGRWPGWLGPVLVVMENALVVWSGLRDFDWSIVFWSNGSDGLEWM